MAEDSAGSGHAQGPIIIKKKRGDDHAGHHGGAWKVAYADMVTALMALFIVLWILAQSQEVRDNIAHYFQDPVGFKEGGMASPIPGGSQSGQPAVLDSSGSPPAPIRDQRALDAMWRGRADKIREALETVPAFARYRDQVELSITPEGLRINLLESNETPLFRVGSTYLNPEAKVMLEAIAREVRQLPNPMVIEGHTDSRPFGIGSRMTNWELSTGRANSARRVFEGTGIESRRMLEIRGFADRVLYNSLDPEDSRNRRVSITLLSDAAVERRLQVPEQVVIPWLAH